MNTPFLAALGGAAALLLAAVLTPIVRAMALRGGAVRGAQEDRWHTRPTPAIGGVAIFVAFVAAVGLVMLLGGRSVLARVAAPAPGAVIPWPLWQGLIAGSSLAFVVGLWDDFYPLRPLTKLAGQLVAASVLVLSGIQFDLPGPALVDAGFSLFWFVAVTNAVNLLDNMDGVAAGTAFIATGFLAALAWMEGQTGLFLISGPFLGATLGFLAHNYPPARIFMGDSGSLFLGLFLGGLALMPVPGGSRSLLAIVAAPALVLAIPLLDTTLVTVGRLLEGRPVSQGGTDHTSHRLVALGASEERTLWTLWALAAAGGGVGLLLRTTAWLQAILLGGLLLAGLTVVAGYLLRVRFRAFGQEVRERIPLYRVAIELHQRFPLGTFLLDGLLLALAYYAAYLLRWDATALPRELEYFQDSVALVVAAKLLAFTVSGVYAHRWEGFSLEAGLRVARASGLGTILALTALVLVQRVGLSRGVLVLDLLLATLLTMGVRFSFRLLDRSARSWSATGTPTLVLGSPEEADLILRVLEEGRHGLSEELRPVAVADPGFPRPRAVFRGLPLYGTVEGLRRGLALSGAGVLVVLDPAPGAPLPESVADALRAGGVDVYRLQMTLERERTQQ